jgi:hypothetical protein
MSKRGERHEQWRKRYEEFLRTGTSRAAFCRKHQLNPETMGYWQRKFERARPTELKATSAFVPVSRASGQRQPIRVTLPNGTLIEMDCSLPDLRRFIGGE